MKIARIVSDEIVAH